MIQVGVSQPLHLDQPHQIALCVEFRDMNAGSGEDVRKNYGHTAFGFASMEYADGILIPAFQRGRIHLQHALDQLFLLVGGYFLFGKYLPAWGYMLVCAGALTLASVGVWIWLKKRGTMIFEEL